MKSQREYKVQFQFKQRWSIIMLFLHFTPPAYSIAYMLLMSILHTNCIKHIVHDLVLLAWNLVFLGVTFFRIMTVADNKYPALENLVFW